MVGAMWSGAMVDAMWSGLLRLAIVTAAAGRPASPVGD
jgi:hypothetical protein